MKRFIVIIAIVLASVGVIAGLVAGAHALRLSYYQIRTGSMEPDYPVGTLVIDSKTIPYAKNHPVTFVADGDVVTHVFRGYNADGSLITRGIANPTNDQWLHPVYPKDVRGTVLFQFKGDSLEFWTSFQGRLTAAGLILLIADALFMWWYFVWSRPVMPKRDRSRDKSPERQDAALAA